MVVAESGDYPGATPLPTTPEQCPRFALGGCYTCISRLAPDAQGNARSKWVFYFDRTDYQVCTVEVWVLNSGPILSQNPNPNLNSNPNSDFF